MLASLPEAVAALNARSLTAYSYCQFAQQAMAGTLPGASRVGKRYVFDLARLDDALLHMQNLPRRRARKVAT